MSTVYKILKWLFIIIVILILGIWIATKVMSESRPDERPNSNPELLSSQMMTALNKPAWDSLKFLKWEFMMGHKYVWDKQDNLAQISWGDNRVLIDLDQVDGEAYKDGEVMSGDDKQSMIQEAWGYWCNDSFWMFAPFKIYDKGTTRKVVNTDSEHKGLMITYDSGGVTPGDSYLWLLGDDYIPDAYKMWTFIPVKGIEMSWENWKTLKGGCKVALSHKSKFMSFDMKGVAEGFSLSDLGYEEDLFAALK